MRIYLEQFQNIVQQPTLYPFYVFSGEDDTLLNACQEQLYSYLNQQGFTGPIYQNCPIELFSSQLSLFSQKEIVVHKLAKSSAEFTKNLLAYTPTEQKIHVILTGYLDKAQLKSKWVQYLETHGVLISLWPPEGLKLKKWLSETAAFFKIALTDMQKNTILDNLANNLAEIYQLLKLLAFCFNSELITDELIHSLLCHQPQYSAQQLIEAILSGNSNSVIEISQYLYKQDQLLLLIWWLTQLLDWWQPASPNKAPHSSYFGRAAQLKSKAQSLSIHLQQKIQARLPSWKNQLFQIDCFAKNSQHLEAKYQVDQLLLSATRTILVYD